MKKLNLTDSERKNVVVDFNVNKFVATVGEDGLLVGTYDSQKRMDADFRLNEITVKNISPLAFSMALSGYGN
jgi:hypothetical protein